MPGEPAGVPGVLERLHAREGPRGASVEDPATGAAAARFIVTKVWTWLACPKPETAVVDALAEYAAARAVEAQEKAASAAVSATAEPDRLAMMMAANTAT